MTRNLFAGAAALTLIAGFATAQSVESQSSQTTVNTGTSSSSAQTTKSVRTNPDGSYEWSKETDTQTHSVPVEPQVVEKSTTTTVTPPPVVEEQTRRTTTTSTSE